MKEVRLHVQSAFRRTAYVRELIRLSVIGLIEQILPHSDKNSKYLHFWMAEEMLAEF